MRFRTLEIRWHDSKPISTCDFQPIAFKKARPSAGQEKNFVSQAYRLATGGEDNHVRVWIVYPNILPSALAPESDKAQNGPRPPRVEYLATLSRHSAPVNVVRFSPNGELIASAGDDGMIIIWAPSTTPQQSTYGSDLTPEELQHEKEFWRPRTTFRCTPMQVYDLAWSPTGDYIIAGSTDNTARVFTAADGKCVYEIAEHTHYVQGVAWDPLNEFIATQSSDRSMHIYRISNKQGTFEAHAVGRNTRMTHHHRHSHSRTPSAHGSRPRMLRSQSTASDVESIADKDESPFIEPLSHSSKDNAIAAPLTPATSVASSSSTMFPPPSIDKPSSRRSSFSGSNAPGSPSTLSRYGRSPSPMPPLPAIRSQPSPTAAWAASIRLYGDESFTNFFRRLTFSPDGGLLLTPAGQFEDPSILPKPVLGNGNGKEESGSTPQRGRKGRPSISTDLTTPTTSASSVYIYSRANFARPPIAQLPGHKKASVAVRFSPILYELRPGVEGIESPAQRAEARTASLERGQEGTLDVDVLGPTANHPSSAPGSSGALLSVNATPFPAQRPQAQSQSIVAPSPVSATSALADIASPVTSPVDLRPPTPAASKPPTPVPTPVRQAASSVSVAGAGTTASIFALPYRMLFAVVTMDTVAIYDTQQAGPICLLSKLHYDEFTDVSWSPDGQCLMLSSRDGYCTLVIFDEILPTYHTQQHTLQLQSIAHHHSVPITYTSGNNHMYQPSSSTLNTPVVTPAIGSVGLPPAGQQVTTPSVPKKRSSAEHQQPPTPAASVDGGDAASDAMSAVPGPSGSSSLPQHVSETENTDKQEKDKVQGPPKKKRRVALTRVGDLGS